MQVVEGELEAGVWTAAVARITTKDKRLLRAAAMAAVGASETLRLQAENAR